MKILNAALEAIKRKRKEIKDALDRMAEEGAEIRRQEELKKSLPREKGKLHGRSVMLVDAHYRDCPIGRRWTMSLIHCNCPRDIFEVTRY